MRQASGVDAAELRHRLRHVYWIGGASGSGKSTIARRLAEDYGLRPYETDVVMSEHAARTTPEESPYLSSFAGMDMDERWVNRSPQEMLETFHWFHGEGFTSIVEDLLELPTEPPVIVEGFRLLPRLVNPLLADPGHALWLLPTPEFREAVFDSRGGASWGFLAKTGDPHKALRNLLERDRLFTDRIAAETQELAPAAIVVDKAITEDDLAQRVAAAFGLMH